LDPSEDHQAEFVNKQERFYLLGRIENILNPADSVCRASAAVYRAK